MKKLRFAMVGTNFIGDMFLEGIKKSGRAEVVALYSRTEEKGKPFAEKYEIPRLFTNYEKMLAAGGFDAVYIASPTFLHKEMTCLALLSGYHVLCEKMIAVNYGEFLEMKRAAEKSGKILLEAMRPDFDPSIDHIENALAKIGSVKEVFLEYRQYSSRYDKFKRGIVENAFNPTLRNSALSDIGIYPLHIAVRLFGLPQRIDARSCFLENGFEGSGELTLDYGSFSARILYSKTYEGENVSYIRGEHGEIVFDKMTEPKNIKITISGENTPEFSPPENNMASEIDAFCNTVMGICDFSDRIKITESTMKLIDEIYNIAGITFPE